MNDEKAPPDVDATDATDESVGGRGFVAEAVRKAVLTTVGALFLTEEGARKLAREWKLPKDVASYVVSQAQGAKDEILRVVTQEIRRFFESETFRREFMKLIGSMSVEVKAEIRLKEAKGKPEVRASVRPRFRRGEPGEDGEP